MKSGFRFLAAASAAIGLLAAPSLEAGHGSHSSSHSSSHGSSHGSSHCGSSHHHGGHGSGHFHHSHSHFTDSAFLFLGTPFWTGVGGWYPPEEGEDGAWLVFAVEPEDAAVYLDGRLLGVAAAIAEEAPEGVAVAPGPHTVEVVRPGLPGSSREIEIEPGQRQTVEISLRP